jgi:hypothetical protein
MGLTMKLSRGKWKRTGISGGGTVSSGLMTISSGVSDRRTPYVGLFKVGYQDRCLEEIEEKLTRFYQYRQAPQGP